MQDDNFDLFDLKVLASVAYYRLVTLAPTLSTQVGGALATECFFFFVSGQISYFKKLASGLLFCCSFTPFSLSPFPPLSVFFSYLI